MSNPLKLLLSLTALMTCVPVAFAQDAGYAPPPMFDDMTPPMVRPNANNGNIVEPKASPNTVLPPDSPNARPVITPRVSVNPDAPQPPVATTKTAPVPKQPVIPPVKPKMMAPIVEPTNTHAETKTEASVNPAVKKPDVKKPKAVTPVPPKKPETKATPKPKAEGKVETPVVPVKPVVPVVSKKAEEAPKEEIKTAPIKRDPQASAIKGPKTMPAIPTGSVDQQKTFESDSGAVERETMLERTQKEAVAQEKEELKPIVPAPKANVAPASFDKNEQGALKKTIPFQQGQIGLSSAEIAPIAVGVNNELDADEKDAWRVQIRSYATPYGTGVSSDKRIALSRALSLRTALIAQGVPAARIDVLAEGQSTDSGNQADRIDLYLYGPAGE